MLSTLLLSDRRPTLLTLGNLELPIGRHHIYLSIYLPLRANKPPPKTNN